MNYRITNQRQLRREFWQTFPNLSRNPFAQLSPKRKLPGVDYPTDTRVAFVEWIDSMQKNGQISEALAQRATF